MIVCKQHGEPVGPRADPAFLAAMMRVIRMALDGEPITPVYEDEDDAGRDHTGRMMVTAAVMAAAVEIGDQLGVPVAVWIRAPGQYVLIPHPFQEITGIRGIIDV